MSSVVKPFFDSEPPESVSKRHGTSFSVVLLKAQGDEPRVQSSATQQITGKSSHSIVIAAALKVHSVLGPGLLESAYETCLAHELRKRGLKAATQVGLPVVYEGEKVELGYRMDLVVEGMVVVEVKSVEAIHPVHQAQLLSYMRLSSLHVGLLINFHVAHLRDEIKRMVDGRDWENT